MSADATVHRWDTMPIDTPMAGVDRKRVIGAQAMLSHVLLKKGTHVPTHAHANEQFAVILKGALRFGLGAEGTGARREVTVRAGEVIHLPANLPHSADAVEETLVLDVFSPPSATTGIDRT